MELSYDLEKKKNYFTDFSIFLGGRLFIDIFISVPGEVAQLYNPLPGFFLLPGHLGGFIERCS